MPAKSRAKVPTVKDAAATNPVASAQSFSERAADENVANESRYAVEGNDLSNFQGVSEEYMTYVGESDVDSPCGWDGSVADNSQEKLDALAEQAESGDSDEDAEAGKLPL